MKTFIKTTTQILAASVGLAVTAGLALAADTEIANPHDEMNKHFAIASERYGNEVHLHSRQDGPDGSRNKVYTFNCVERMYNEVFDGDSAPANFPVDPDGSSSEPIESNSTAAALAAHACKQYGVPLVGIEW